MLLHAMYYFLLLLLQAYPVSCLSGKAKQTRAVVPKGRIIPYFAIGSNMLPSTMKDLRRISVDESTTTAGILPRYRLALNVPGFGQSAVSGMRRADEDDNGGCLHGVLYYLTPDEFAVVGSTEGVPFAYQWERCDVIPYHGDGDSAGKRALQDEQVTPVTSFLLTANGNKMESYTSTWYKDILQEGAVYWGLDRSYQNVLKDLPTAPSFWPFGRKSKRE